MLVCNSVDATLNEERQNDAKVPLCKSMFISICNTSATIMPATMIMSIRTVDANTRAVNFSKLVAGNTSSSIRCCFVFRSRIMFAPYSVISIAEKEYMVIPSFKNEYLYCNGSIASPLKGLQVKTHNKPTNNTIVKKKLKYSRFLSITSRVHTLPNLFILKVSIFIVLFFIVLQVLYLLISVLAWCGRLHFRCHS